jgi:hypothetical protein
MAITVTTLIDKGTRAFEMAQGLNAVVAEITLVAGGATDLPLDVELIKAQVGFRRIYTVIGLSATNNAGTMLADKVWFTFQQTTSGATLVNKLHAWKADAAAMTADGGTNLDAGSKVRVLVLGV